MRRAKAYSTFCSQVVLVYLHPFRRNSLFAAKNRQKSLKPLFWGSRSFKIIYVDIPKKLVASACYDKQHVCAYLQLFSRKTSQQWTNNYFSEKYLYLIPACAILFEPRGFGLELRKSTFNAENYMCRLFWSISSHFNAIHSWNACRSPKSRKIH